MLSPASEEAGDSTASKGSTVIRHVALFRFKPEFTEEQRQAWIVMIRDLPQHIPEVKALCIGTDVVGGPDSYDVGLVADFDSLADMDAYNKHPRHQDVLAVSGPVKEHLAVVDFEYSPEP